MSDVTEDRRLVLQLLADSGLSEDLIRNTTEGELASVVAAIGAAADELPTEEQGGVRIIIAGRSVSVGEVGWKLLTSTAALGISMMDPTHVTKAIALKEALDLFKELRPLLKKLDVSQAIVCTAIMNVTAEKKRKTLMVSPPGASKAEIESYFTARDEIPPIGLDDILKGLEDKVIVANHYPDSGPFYSIKF